MASKKMIEHRNNIFNTLRKLGYEEDRWGHFKKTVASGNVYRVKVQKTSLRFEKRVKLSGYRGNEWVRVSSDYFGKIKVEEKSVVIGGIRLLGGK